ncbi:MAG TPA: hypothetical protein PLI09_07915 [Candidatus Hydrogenedentes bacterium]|nr:hypothetical protein [Candidatus Hydrogenedentota bacterium]
MSVSKQTGVEPVTGSFQNLVPLVLRIFWMLVGNFILLITCLYILNERISGFTWLDILYWVALVLALAARYIEITYYQGRKADGEPATRAHWVRYALIMLVLATAGWLAVHGIIQGLG